MDQQSSPEKGRQLSSAPEQAPRLIVEQPKQLENVLEMIGLLDAVSERVTEDRSQGAGPSAGKAGGARAQKSARDQAIESIPVPEMQRMQLQKQIRDEVRGLEKQVKVVARRAARPGGAHKLNTLYARIRRLNSLLSNLFEASQDVIRRLFVRVFVDKQSIL
jgi:hypothetical protein